MDPQNIFYGQIVNSLSKGTEENVLVIKDSRWRLYELQGSGDDSSSSDGKKYKKIRLPDPLTFIDLEKKEVAIREGCEQKIVSLSESTSVQNLLGPELIKTIGTFKPVVGTTKIGSVTYAGTQIIPVIGETLTLNGTFQPARKSCNPCAPKLGKCLLNKDELIALIIPSEAITPINLTIDLGALTTAMSSMSLTSSSSSLAAVSSSTKIKIPLLPANGVVLGYVDSYIPPSDSSNGSLTLNVLFSTFNVPFISKGLLDLLTTTVGSVLSDLSPVIGTLIDELLAFISGPILNGQAFEVKALYAPNKTVD